MARLTDFKGLDEAVKDMVRKGELMSGTAERMVRVGALEMANARKQEAERRGLKSPDGGAMIKNIRPTRTIKHIGGQLTLDVFSQGKETRGKKQQNTVRNATKEFMDHYGYKSRPASHWIDSAEKKGTPPAEKAMLDVYDREIGTEV